MEVSFYKHGDKRHILSLFQSSFKRPMSQNYWRWRFQQLERADQLILLAWENDILVGHYAVSPVNIAFKSETLPAALSLTTMVHPNWQRRNIFTYLASKLYEKLWEEGYKCVFGFPNNSSFKGFTSKLNWTAINDIIKLRCIIPHSKPKGSCVVSICDTFTLGHNTLISRFYDNKIMVERNLQYLKWRYLYHPINKYYIFNCYHNQELVAYCVTSMYATENGVECQFVDMIARTNSYAEQLLLEVIRYYFNKNIFIFTIWSSLGSEKLKMLLEMGFEKTNEVTHFGGLFKGQISDMNIFYEKDSWYLTMGDSDVY